MGGRIASRLVDAGHAVIGYDLDPSRVRAGARAAGDVAALVAEVPLIGRETSLAWAPLGKAVVKLPQEFPRSHRRRTWLEAPEHVRQPTHHAEREELLFFGRRGLFGSTGHDPGC